MLNLTPAQRTVLESPPEARIFLSGPAGCGKTTVAAERLRQMLSAGIPAGSILVLTPQRTLQVPFEQVVNAAGHPPSFTQPTATPTPEPTATPTPEPTATPTVAPEPTQEPAIAPTDTPAPATNQADEPAPKKPKHKKRS